MKCLVLVANKMSTIPIVECGGIVLADEQKIIVREEIAVRMLPHYRKRLISTGSCDMPSLRGGDYQVVGETYSLPVSSPVEEIAENRSMENVAKAKRKTVRK